MKHQPVKCFTTSSFTDIENTLPVSNFRDMFACIHNVICLFLNFVKFECWFILDHELKLTLVLFFMPSALNRDPTPLKLYKLVHKGIWKECTKFETNEPKSNIYVLPHILRIL